MIMKYSIGGPITSVEDQESIERKEDVVPATMSESINVVICKKCGLQHMIEKNEIRLCCDKSIKSSQLS